MVNKIRNNAINTIPAKEGLNTLNKTKNAEIINYKKHTLKQKELLNLFNDLLDTILTDKTLMSSNENGNENGNENDKTMSSREDDNETMNQNNSNTIKELNGSLDKIIDESRSFEDQIKLIKNIYISKWVLLYQRLWW